MATSPRRRSLLLGTLVAVLALVAAFGAAAAVASMQDDDEPEREVEAELKFLPEDKEAPDSLSTGLPVPTAAWEELEGGDEASFADYEGRPVVVNFFGSWCLPCRKEMPAFQQVFEEVGDDVAFVGLAVRDSKRDAAAFIEEMGTTYDIGRDTSGELLAALGGVTMPSTFLVSAEGRVVAAQAGEIEAGELRELIAQHLGK